jgi:branched-chain amino acid transport system permease protein
MTSTSTPGATSDVAVAPARTRTPRSRRSLFLGPAVWFVVALIVPWLGLSDAWMNIGVFALIAAVGALGMQVIMGFAGQVSLGHAVFMAVGAYTAAWLGVDHGQPWWVWLPAAALVSAAVGAIVAPAAVRIRGLYLAVATLALVFIALWGWETWTSLTGGINGRTAATVVIGGQDLLTGVFSGNTEVLSMFQAWWYFALAILMLTVVVTWNIKRSRLGRAMMAVRDRDLAAGVAGIPVTSTKVTAFAISSAMAGVSGAMLAAFLGYISANQWTLGLSIDFIAMVVIGGSGAVGGAVLGAFFVRAMPEIVNQFAGVLPFISKEAKVDGGITVPLLSQFLYGLTIVLVLIFEPRGITAIFRRLSAALRGRKKGVSS